MDQAYSAYWLGGAPAPSAPAPDGGLGDDPGSVLTDVHARVDVGQHTARIVAQAAVRCGGGGGGGASQPVRGVRLVHVGGVPGGIPVVGRVIGRVVTRLVGGGVGSVERGVVGRRVLTRSVPAAAAAPGGGRGPARGAAGGAGPAGRPARPRTGGSRGAPSAKPGGAVARTATGVAAAVVTAVLAVVVAGQVEDGTETQAQARPADVERQSPDAASRSDSRPTPNGGVAAPVTYEQKMDRKYPLDAKAKGSGSFDTVGGHDRAPGRGDVVHYRVDVEKGLPLDGELFATAVHRTLNDERSWGHGGTRTFERVSSGDADFVITLASPGTTAAWCAKSGLDTTQDNVSCDSAATDRVMINAYRWAQGAATYGDKMHAYRQMLINHEVGHRLGRDHESCSKEGALAPVMMQQTKFLTSDGVTCKPNAWPYP
nr:DUF3152 domain-containing protein [Streptomyces roseifaciens]